MKIFGREFTTKTELRATIDKLENEMQELRDRYYEARVEIERRDAIFPFEIGQTVYDIQLRDENGRYVTDCASFEHSIVNTVVVDEKNYFGLVERYKRNDVFVSYVAAKAFLKSVCVK